MMHVIILLNSYIHGNIFNFVLTNNGVGARNQKILFMLFSVYSTVQWGKHMYLQSLLANELSLINGCGTRENNNHGHT